MSYEIAIKYLLKVVSTLSPKGNHKIFVKTNKTPTFRLIISFDEDKNSCASRFHNITLRSTARIPYV